MRTGRAPPLIGPPIGRAMLHCEGPTLADAYDHVIINRPPRFADVTRPATMASDVVIIPV